MVKRYQAPDRPYQGKDPDNASLQSQGRRTRSLGGKAIDCLHCGYGISFSIFKQDADGNMETYLQCGKCKMIFPAPKAEVKLAKMQNKQGGYFSDFVYKGENRQRYGTKYLRDDKGNIIGEKKDRGIKWKDE